MSTPYDPYNRQDPYDRFQSPLPHHPPSPPRTPPTPGNPPSHPNHPHPSDTEPPTTRPSDTTATCGSCAAPTAGSGAVATLTALGYFTLFLILSAFAPGFMTGTVTDGLPAGLLLALLQLPVTWLAIGLYEHTARRYLDPIADRIRKEAAVDAKREAGQRRAGR